MTDRKPPQTPPPVPRLDDYRPRQDRPSAPQPMPQREPRPHPYPPRPLPQGAAQRRPLQREAERPGPRRGFSVLGMIGIALLALVVVIGAGGAYLVLNPPVELIRSQLVAQVKSKTGRDLRIGGAARFTVYPSVGVSLDDVELSAPPAMGGRPLLKTAGLDLSLQLLPLLARDVRVEKLVLRQPVIELRADKSGRRSWDFADLEDAGRVRMAQAATPNRSTDAPPAGAPRRRDPLALVEQMTLGDVRIEGGRISYLDEKSGSKETVDAVNLMLAMPSTTGPLETKGDLVWKGERFDISGSLTSLKAIVEAKPAKLVMTASNRLGTAAYDGNTVLNDHVELGGALTLRSPDVRALAKLAGAELPQAGGFGAASISGQLKSDARSATLSNAKLALDSITGSGTIGVDVAGARPLLKGNLKLSALDLNPYLGGTPSATQKPAQPKAVAPGPAAAPVARPAPSNGGQPASIEDLLSQPGPQVRGFTQRAGWSEDALSTAALGALDAELALQIAALVYQDVKVGASQLTINLRNRVLKTTIDDMQLYQGRGRGVVTLDGTAAAPSIGVNVTADGLAALPLLKDAARMDWLAGTGRLVIAVAGQGPSQKAIVDSLNGKADFTFNNGAIVGWNVPQIIRGLRQGQLSGFDRVSTSQTDFSELASTWTIAGGIAQNQDLKLTSPLLRVTGAGRVLMGARQIDYLVKPKLVASLDGQGGTQGLAGLEIPVRIRGGWEKPEVVPELNGVLSDPNKALGAVKDLTKQFKGKKPEEIVNQVLGDNPATAKKANDLLNKFLKPKKPAEAAPAPAQ